MDLGIKDLAYRGEAWEPGVNVTPEPAEARPVAIGLRIYRTLAAAFPHEFKNAYGEELAQVCVATGLKSHRLRV